MQPADAKVSLFDRGYLLGDSVFETLRAYEGRIFRLARHVGMLERGAGELGIASPPASEVAAIVRATLDRSGLGDAYIRVTLSRGEGPPGLGVDGYAKPVLSVIVREFHPYPAEGYVRGIAAAVVGGRKSNTGVDPSIKTGSCVQGIVARREAASKGALEGIQLGVDGHVVSGIVSNVFAVTGGVLRTPDTASGCRLGVTREALLELAGDLRIEARQERLGVSDLLEAGEVFFANTLMECLPVSVIDGSRVPDAPGPTCRRLSEAFRALVARETHGDA